MAIGSDNGKRQEAGRGADEGHGRAVNDQDRHSSGSRGGSRGRGFVPIG
jgi:hypothetical protein